ncbi:unnamed protein product, partial [Didymodactylos carnosus]
MDSYDIPSEPTLPHLHNRIPPPTLPRANIRRKPVAIDLNAQVPLSTDTRNDREHHAYYVNHNEERGGQKFNDFYVVPSNDTEKFRNDRNTPTLQPMGTIVNRPSTPVRRVNNLKEDEDNKYIYSGATTTATSLNNNDLYSSPPAFSRTFQLEESLSFDSNDNELNYQRHSYSLDSVPDVPSTTRSNTNNHNDLTELPTSSNYYSYPEQLQSSIHTEKDHPIGLVNTSSNSVKRPKSNIP